MVWNRPLPGRSRHQERHILQRQTPPMCGYVFSEMPGADSLRGAPSPKLTIAEYRPVACLKASCLFGLWTEELGRQLRGFQCSPTTECCLLQVAKRRPAWSILAAQMPKPLYSVCLQARLQAIACCGGGSMTMARFIMQYPPLHPRPKSVNKHETSSLPPIWVQGNHE